MESNYELKEINVKNHTCYYFDDQIKFKDFDLDNILIDEKSYKNILVYYISSKTWIVDKPLCIKFNKVDGYIRVYDGNRYLVLYSPEKYHCVKSVQILSFFWFVFSCIRTEYGDLLGNFLYSVRIQENTDQKNSVFGHFSCSDFYDGEINTYIHPDRQRCLNLTDTRCHSIFKRKLR